MESFAIMGTGPLAFVASIIFCVLLRHFVPDRPALSSALTCAATLVLCAASAELVLVLSVGAVRARELIGVLFYPLHLALFILGTPAQVTVLSLRSNAAVPSFVVGAASAVVAILLVVLQYDVSERLYGVDGTGGPYGYPF